MPVNSRTRPARPGEHEAVASCVRAAYSKYVKRIGKQPAPMLADYAALIDEGVVYVLTDGLAIAGVLVMKPVDDAMLLENVAVSPSYQGLGLGRELMRFVEEAAYDSGLHKVNLYTNELMTENVAFYQRLGFREMDRRLEDGYRRIFMSKELPERF